jgi:hypothetical protein
MPVKHFVPTFTNDHHSNGNGNQRRTRQQHQ